MSFLLKFIDSGFLLTFGLILLISGGIMLYCYRRLNLLEKSVIEHGKILQNFIINYNIQMQHLSLLNNSVHSSKNNDNNVENSRTEYVDFDKIKKINLGGKISVSDDDDEDDVDDEVDVDDDDDDDEDEDKDEDDDEDEDNDEDDDDDDDDDEEDEDEDEDNDDEDDEDKKISKNNMKKDNLENLTISDNKFTEDLEILQDLEELENLEDLTSMESLKLNDETISSVDDETFLKNLPINLKTFTLETNNNPKIINLETIDNSNDKTGERKNYSKMKVDDLKSLVVTKNLTDNETAQKMKKSDLVKLLQS